MCPEVVTGKLTFDAAPVNVAESLKGIEIGEVNWLSGHTMIKPICPPIKDALSK